MNNATTIDRPVQLLPIAHSANFDVRLSDTGNLVLYREDTGNLILTIPLAPDQIAEIQSASK